MLPVIQRQMHSFILWENKLELGIAQYLKMLGFVVMLAVW